MAGFRPAQRSAAVLIQPGAGVSQAGQWAVSTAPGITGEQLDNVLREFWGLSGELQPLYAERDLNARLQTPQGTDFLVKVSHPDTDLAQLDFQDRAIQHVALSAPELPVPRLIPGHSGACRLAVQAGYRRLQIRVFSWLPGNALPLDKAPPGPAFAAGQALAELGLALRDCPAEGGPTSLPWDLQHLQNLAPLTSALSSAQGRQLTEQVLADHAVTLRPALAELPCQVIHNDLNPENILFDESRPPRVSGIIDFGDLVVAPLVCDLAVACAYLVSPDEADPFIRVNEAIAAYLQVQHLGNRTLALLPDLIACRQVTTLLIQGYRVAQGQDRNGQLAEVCRRARTRMEASFSDAGQRFRESLSDPG